MTYMKYSHSGLQQGGDFPTMLFTHIHTQTTRHFAIKVHKGKGFTNYHQSTTISLHNRPIYHFLCNRLTTSTVFLCVFFFQKERCFLSLDSSVYQAMEALQLKTTMIRRRKIRERKGGEDRCTKRA